MSKGRLEIKDKDLLIKILKIITFLDEKRWSEKNQEKEKEKICRNFCTGLEFSDIILTHWLCYIEDRMTLFMRVWENGGAVFSELVREYKSPKSLKEILEKFREEKIEKGKKKIIFKAQREEEPKKYSLRFGEVDDVHIRQTLKILDEYEISINNKKYKRNLVAFILHFLETLKDKEPNERFKRIAYALYLLTYRIKKKEKKPLELKGFLELWENEKEWKDEKGFKDEKEFEEFCKKSTEGKKRLWASLRDYKKGFFSNIFKKAIEDIAGEKANYFIRLWEELPMDVLELPGDRWNNNPRFIKGVLGKAIEFPENLPKSLNISKIIREVYERLMNEEKYKNELEKINFYPERFDVTFDFARKMCEEKLCNICPFGEKGAESICIPNKNYCTVALTTCGYLAPCDEENCIIRKEDPGRGICSP